MIHIILSRPSLSTPGVTSPTSSRSSPLTGRRLLCFREFILFCRLAFPFPKNGQFRNIFNYAIKKIIESGEMDRVRAKWTMPGTGTAGKFSKLGAVRHNQLLPFMTILGCGHRPQMVIIIAFMYVYGFSGQNLTFW